MSGFFVGPGKTVLMPDELLKSFFVPAPAEHTGAAYKKYAIRGDSDISIVGAGARLTLREDGAIAEARITLASVAPTPGAHGSGGKDTCRGETLRGAVCRGRRDLRPECAAHHGPAGNQGIPRGDGARVGAPRAGRGVRQS